MKRAFAVLLSLALVIGLLSACGGSIPINKPSGDAQQPSEAEPLKQIKVLRVIFVPSHDAQEILDAVEPLKGLLTTELASSGYEVGEVKITVGDSYEAVGDALAAGGADVAVGMPGGTYVLYDNACDVILTSTRNGLSKDYDDAKSWNDEMPTVSVDIQTTFYRALLIAGPSETGRALAAKVNSGQKLTWAELDAANWSIMDTTSSAGYIYPCLWLEKQYGKGISALSHTVVSHSYDEAFKRLASGEVDVLMTYADARRDYATQWNAEFGREESIWGDTNVIGVTPGIYNDTVTTSKASPIMDAALEAALQEAFIRLAETEAGKAAIAIYNHKGYQKAVSSDYDNERAAQALLSDLS
ncbi:MAG: PhnD/SsuA/transferrin family substrate-binding protein [Oscillospiraceae bacterium]|nr:PhnD/SsuA/transferrin family substrate-binding protein [Oscillospiraceae bacterium]